MPLTPDLLISAYCQGIFPMAHDEDIYWYDPDPRAIIPLDGLHVSRSLRRTLRQGKFEIRRNTAFGEVIRACARHDLGRDEVWITPAIIAAYEDLYAAGYAHSVETWHDGKLVGGLYGVAVRGLFAGESMFSHVRDASKVALVALVEHLNAQGFTLLDTQFLTEHLARMGAIEIPRAQYHLHLKMALQTDAHF